MPNGKQQQSRRERGIQTIDILATSLIPARATTIQFVNALAGDCRTCRR
jgi:hypothetical protein